MIAGPLARRIADRALRARAVNSAVRALAGARGHRLVLVYHRVGDSGPPHCQIVPSIPVDVFMAQLRVLIETVDLVPLERIAGGRSSHGESHSHRPAVAITFDDDLPSHAAVALPALQAMGVRAAFFLSGRSLHGEGPYWFQQLEVLLASYGTARAAALLGVPDAAAADLALACERHPCLRRRVVAMAGHVASPGLLDRSGIEALRAAGMTVGFHTIDHETLPDMADAELHDAVTRGRTSLARVVGAPLRYFAYPHGKADARTADAVRHAGFDAAFTGRPEPLRPGHDRYRLGRWEPGALDADDFVVKLAVRLHRAAPRTQPGLDS